MKRKEQIPLPNYRKANLPAAFEATQEAADATSQHFLAVCRRQDEIARLSELFNQLEPPASIDGRKLSPLDVTAYALAVNYARGTASDPEKFFDVVGAQTKKASVRFFKICAAAMEAVKVERDHKYSVTDGHRMAALQAKLELERNTGTLPTQKQVKDRAFQIVSIFIKNRNQDFAPYEPGHKRWSKILTSVELDYLLEGVRGKGQ